MPDGHPIGYATPPPSNGSGSGVPLEEVSKLLGHASIKTAERHCAPWVSHRRTGRMSLSWRRGRARRPRAGAVSLVLKIYPGTALYIVLHSMMHGDQLVSTKLRNDRESAKSRPDSTAPSPVEKWEIQLRKGCLELAVLGCLSAGKLYGLEILRRLENDSGLTLSAGTVYPFWPGSKLTGCLIRNGWRPIPAIPASTTA